MSDERFFNAADFSSVGLTVLFRNLTSRADELPGDSVSVQEVAEDSVVLGLPSKSCQINHSVQLVISRVDPERSQPLVLRATGKIVEIEASDSRAEIRARITFVQIDEAVWKTLVSYQEDRQNAVLDFLTRARG